VRRAGVTRHHQLRAPRQRDEIGDGRLRRQHGGARCAGDDLAARVSSPGPHRTTTSGRGLAQLDRDRSQPRGRPAFVRPCRPGFSTAYRPPVCSAYRAGSGGVDVLDRELRFSRRGRRSRRAVRVDVDEHAGFTWIIKPAAAKDRRRRCKEPCSTLARVADAKPRTRGAPELRARTAADLIRPCRSIAIS